MIKVKYLVLILVYFSFNLLSQNKIPELQKFSDITAFNLEDTLAIDLAGEWFGEEIQYDPTQSFVKVKFKITFKFKQEGNKIYGTSYIEDKYRGSYGDMKIRGIVIGDKLHFEEYEILEEKFYEPGVIWCLRSGELLIKKTADSILLEGLDYSGYASTDYFKCTDYVKMSVAKPLEKKNINNSFTNNSKGKDPYSENNEIKVFPNPFFTEATIAYTLLKRSKVQIDIFALNGMHIKTLFQEESEAGNYKLPFHLSEHAAGVYFIRLLADNKISTKQIVKTR